MARHLLVSAGTAGDVHAFVAIGIALRERGHEVALLTNSTFEGLVRNAGLTFHATWLEEESERAFNTADFWDPVRGPQLAWHWMGEPVMRRSYDLIERAAGEDRCVLTASWTAFGARLAHEKLGVSLCTVYQAPASLQAYRRTEGAPTNLLDRLFCPKLNAFRRELGLSPVTHVCDEWMHSPQQGVALFPEWFAGERSWPEHVSLTDFPLADPIVDSTTLARLELFLAQGPPPIVFAAASEVRHASAYFDASMSACLTTNRRAVFLSRHRGQIPERLPASILHLDRAPLDYLLPRAALLVHHGGIGTCAQAMRASVPQLIVPNAFDQFDNASRLVSLGVGLWIRRSEYVGKDLPSLFEKMENSQEMRARCAVVAKQFSKRACIDDICAIIEAMN